MQQGNHPFPLWIQETQVRLMASQTGAPVWFREKQTAAWRECWQQGLPTTKNERWKYADLSFIFNEPFSLAESLAEEKLHDLREAIQQHRLQRGDSALFVLVNGYFVAALSDLAKLPPAITACRLDEALTNYPDLVQTLLATHLPRHYPFANLNAAMCQGGLFLSVPDHCHLDIPIHFLSIATDQTNMMVHPRHFLLLGKNSKLVMLEEHFSLSTQTYFMNHVMHIMAEQNALLEHYKMIREGNRAIHFGHTFVQQKKDSTVSMMHLSGSGAFARHEVFIRLAEPGASCRTQGFYQLYDGQYVDYHIDIHHAASHSQSEMLYKGIIEKKARAVFNGRLCVEKDVQKILAYQANHHLLLSAESEAYSNPALEIYADDVKCKHGASTGQVDQSALFYLRSRGISEEEALNILLAGFAEEILQRITHAGVLMRAKEII